MLATKTVAIFFAAVFSTAIGGRSAEKAAVDAGSPPKRQAKAVTFADEALASNPSVAEGVPLPPSRILEKVSEELPKDAPEMFQVPRLDGSWTDESYEFKIVPSEAGPTMIMVEVVNRNGDPKGVKSDKPFQIGPAKKNEHGQWEWEGSFAFGVTQVLAFGGVHRTHVPVGISLSYHHNSDPRKSSTVSVTFTQDCPPPESELPPCRLFQGFPSEMHLFCKRTGRANEMTRNKAGKRG